MKRRTFLQRAGWLLAALGVSETGLSILGGNSIAVPLLDRYYQALAQPTGRKLALLVGINQYPRSNPLSGCVTDVELQRELLTYRFGFNPSDILTVTDREATRENIETAFVEHLIEQAKADDVVLFHFSGYGSQVNREDVTQNALVPVDGILDVKGTPLVNNLLAETLFLLLRSLPTDRVTAVLDTSYTEGKTSFPGNLRTRSYPEILEEFGDEERAFQEKLLMRLNSSPEQLQKQRRWGEMPGIVLTASSPTQAAAEAAWSGFSAGLFTYALTQHLWQTTPPTTVQVSLSRAAVVVEQLVGKDQQPQLIGKNSQDKSLLPYNVAPELSLGADGVVTAIEEGGKTAQLWLAGLPTRVLADYAVNSLLTVVNSEPTLKLQIRSREGLTAKARLLGSDSESISPLQVGQFVQESIRVLPRHLGLTVALDAHLERIERVDATSAFAYVPSVSSVVVAGEQPADYVFAKESARSPQEGYGLFFPGGNPIPNTLGEASEAIKSGVNRLAPKLKNLLAAKIWRLLVNEEASRLGLAATLESVSPNPQVLMQRQTLRFPQENALSISNPEKSIPGGIPNLASGSRIQYRLQNYSDRPIYFILVGVDSSSNAIAFYPQGSLRELDASDANVLLLDAVIQPQQTLTLPQPSGSFEWLVQGQPGLVETYLICSRAPFTQTIAAMSTSIRPKGERERVGDLLNPLDVAQAMLQDLHQASSAANENAIDSVSAEMMAVSSDSYVLDVNSWATFSFVYQVV